jgi:hypothetical protein
MPDEFPDDGLFRMEENDSIKSPWRPAEEQWNLDFRESVPVRIPVFVYFA